MADGSRSAAPGIPLPLGVVLAGGASRRFGSEKSLFPLAGRPMAAWVLDALRPWTSGQVLITPSTAAPETLGVPGRPDLVPGLGPIGGLETALAWAEELGHPRILLLACDLPLLTSDLVGRLLREWPPGVHAVVPESPGPLGYEPLCAGFEVAGRPVLEKVIDKGGRSMERGLEALGFHRIPMERMGTKEELERAFTNVNHAEGMAEVERLLQTGAPARNGGGDR